MRPRDAAIRINVDLTNPGQFFACCGLLELADRLWLGAEGWFEDNQFHIACDGSLKELFKRVDEAGINSSLTDEQLKKLGSLMSLKKTALTADERAEKDRLRRLWQAERLYLGKPFELCLDWWRDVRGERTALKTWAAKQFVLEVARPLHRATTQLEPDSDLLTCTAKVDGLPFYFDSSANSQNTPRDTGFGLYALRSVVKTQEAVRPALELLAFFGLQRFRPTLTSSGRAFRFTSWPVPLPALVAQAAVSQTLALRGERHFEFRLLNRSKYMKAFLPARPV